MVKSPGELPPFIPAGGTVHFPESPKDEARRIGRYFEEHPVEVSQVEQKKARDTYGDEDTSLPDRPMGDK